VKYKRGLRGENAHKKSLLGLLFLGAKFAGPENSSDLRVAVPGLSAPNSRPFFEVWERFANGWPGDI